MHDPMVKRLRGWAKTSAWDERFFTHELIALIGAITIPPAHTVAHV